MKAIGPTIGPGFRHGNSFLTLRDGDASNVVAKSVAA